MLASSSLSESTALDNNLHSFTARLGRSIVGEKEQVVMAFLFCPGSSFSKKPKCE